MLIKVTILSCFQVGLRCFFVHRCILGSRSSYFYEMFHSIAIHSTVELSDVDVQDVEIFTDLIKVRSIKACRPTRGRAYHFTHCLLIMVFI